LHTGILERFDFESILLQLPSEMQRLRAWVDPACESLPESLARTRLRLAGHTVDSQVILPTRERIDLVVDKIVGLEVDGEEFHVNRFIEDRNKDLAMTIEGFHALRPAANHVFHDWARVEVAINVALRERGAPAFGNSGVVAARGRKARGNTAGPVRHRRRTPEFPKSGGTARRR
jgi:very-short-patch-repair endonuclease